jgi:hypothetical protein
VALAAAAFVGLSHGLTTLVWTRIPHGAQWTAPPGGMCADDRRRDGRVGQQRGKRNLIRPQSPVLAEPLNRAADLQLRFGEPGPGKAHIADELPLHDLRAGQQPAVQRRERHDGQPELPAGGHQLAFGRPVDEVVFTWAQTGAGCRRSSAIHNAWVSCQAGWLDSATYRSLLCRTRSSYAASVCTNGVPGSGLCA